MTVYRYKGHQLSFYIDCDLTATEVERRLIEEFRFEADRFSVVELSDAETVQFLESEEMHKLPRLTYSDGEWFLNRALAADLGWQTTYDALAKQRP